MEKQILADLLDKQLNGFIIINKNKEVIYKNKTIEKLFGNEVHRLLGNYLKCKYTILEKVNCQHTTNCISCIINRSVDRLVKTGETQISKDVEFECTEKVMIFSVKIYYVNEFIALELFNIGQSYERLNFLSNLVEKSSDMMIFKDSKLGYRYVNKSAENFFGIPKEQILNKTDEDLMQDELLNQCKRGDIITLEQGKYSAIETFGDSIFRVSKEYINGGILCIAKDITEEVKATKRAEIDSLTGLYNRRKFMNIIDEIYESKESNYYLALIDLDNLRSLNNEYGHLKGDEYLIKIGNVLINHSEGLFFRLGGDEFAGLIYKDKDGVELMFNSIFDELDGLDYQPKLSISVGIKKIDVNHSYLYNYEQVDKLLYRVKENGKNKFSII